MELVRACQPWAVVRRDGTIVARPFDKFFNWGEGGRTTDAGIKSVTEKVDGSLGIIYWNGGQLHVATRGSFDSSQAQWATQFLRANCLDIEWLEEMVRSGYTPLVEIVHPGNRIVVDYGDYAGLILLAVRRIDNGSYKSLGDVMHWGYRLGLSRPRMYNILRVNDIIAMQRTIDANQEGWVVEFVDGQRFKFKGRAYMDLHRMINGLSLKTAAEAVATSQVDAIRERVPDEFLREFNGWVLQVEAEVKETLDTVADVYTQAPTGSRKELALWATTYHKNIMHYLFAMADGRDVRAMVFKDKYDIIIGR